MELGTKIALRRRKCGNGLVRRSLEMCTGLSTTEDEALHSTLTLHSFTLCSHLRGHLHMGQAGALLAFSQGGQGCYIPAIQ